MPWTATPRYVRLLFSLVIALSLLLPGRSRAQTGPASQGLVADSTELRALRQFYYATGGPAWTTNTNWLQGITLADAAGWYGVGVSGGDVTQLSFFNNHLVGLLPACLSQLTALTSLNLQANQLSGSIPPALGRLSQLQNLGLASNLLTGTLPNELGQLTHLIGFGADNNQLTGSLPASFGNWQQLQSLSITNNQLSGPIPNRWGRMRDLLYLLLDHNQLTGPLPDSIGDCSHLSSIRLGVNQLTGSLPARWGRLKHLNHLWLAGNRLSGVLPDSINEWHELGGLGLDFNQFSGPLPEHLEGLQSLSGLDLSNNRFSGPLPASFGQLTHLSYCTLSRNQFSGALPASLGRLHQVSILDLSNNQFSGSLPDSLGQCSNLQYLLLDFNRFSGPLPAAWGQLPNLHGLDARANGLSGALPTTWGTVPLQQLILLNNQFSGVLPANLLRQPQLQALYLDNNNLTEVDDLGNSQPLPLYLSVTGNYLSYAALERFYQGPGVLRVGTLIAHSQRPSPHVDTLAYQAGQPLTLALPARVQPAAHPHAYQWQRQVGGQWLDLPADTLATHTWPRATAAEQGWYRRLERNRWVSGLGPLASPILYADLLPYRPLAQNRPDDENQGTGSTLAKALGLAEDTTARDLNYVRSWIPRVAVTAAGRVAVATIDSIACSTQYFDGLGRPLQTVQHEASPTRRDLVQPLAYDGLGREPRQYLSYPAAPVATRQGYHAGALAAQDAFYRRTEPVGGGLGPLAPDDPIRGVARTGAAYAESIFEASPLNRVVAQGAPGEAWQVSAGHAVERRERPNTAQDSVLRFVPGYAPGSLDPGYQGLYAPGELWGTDVSEPHGPSEPGARGYRTIEWKDQQGQLVLKQVEAARTSFGGNLRSRWLRTAYVYDDFGRLRFVLQPEGVKRQLALAQGPPPLTAGSIEREEWTGILGGSVADIPLTTLPNNIGKLTSLEGPTNNGDYYGDRIRGYLLPPQTGNYTFWIAGDDNCELWLSSDRDPAHRQRVAYVPGWTPARQWLYYGQQQSAPVSLVAGQAYYLEVLHKEGGGGDNLAVTWQLPDGTQFGEPISGIYLAPYTAQSGVNDFLFHYRYDGRGRQIAKQVPGQQGETVVVYDQLDRPVLSQDAQQRTRHEWSWTKYDALGRAILSGLVNRADTLGQVGLQALASADTLASQQYEQRTALRGAYPLGLTTDHAFPRLGQQGFGSGQVLNATYYDDYDFDNNGQPDVAYDPSTDGQFTSGQAPVVDILRTQGLITRTQTRVLRITDTDDKQAAWLTTTTFYDERAHPVQVQTSNARKVTSNQQGRDVLTTQLDFTGKVVQSVASHQGPNLAQPLLVKEQFTYDHTGRLLTSRQQLPDETQPALLDSLIYNELGQVMRKAVGTGRLRQDEDYAYNVRGWLTRLNDPYFPVQGDLFNLSLHYERGFTKGYEQYNGNLTGQTWRGRDGVQRAYGYVYDATSRLLQGDYVARQTTTSVMLNAGAWKAEEDNYRLSFVSYDDNGNILTLRRRGLLQNATRAQGKQYGAVDNLSYVYQGNRLLAVDDQVTENQLPRPTNYNGAPTSLAGDFQEQGVKLGQEYLYDANGNLIQDKNKGITGILYNHLNLPQQIQFGQVGDSIVFHYSASGQKVAKLVYQTGKPVQRTDYLGPYQYEQDSLKFFPHAEGRVLRFVSYNAAGAPHIKYQREFTFKDHLGNLRLAYRAGQVRTLTATLEQDFTTRKREVQQFDSLSISQPIAVATPLARSGQWAAKLNAGGNTPQPLGLLTHLGVQKGDTVTVTAYGTYLQAQQSGFLFSLASFITTLLHPVSSQPMGLEAGKRKDLPLLQVGLSAGLVSLPQLASGVPQGYLRLLVFDKDSVLQKDQCRVVQLTQAASGGYEQLRLQAILPQDGYVTAYVGSQSNVDVFFDDVAIEHRQGLQVQENQYDPWGQNLTGVEYNSPGLNLSNRYQFNGKEQQGNLGLNWSDYGLRGYDGQLGLWHGVDFLADKYLSTSPYCYTGNNPTNVIDVNGAEWATEEDKEYAKSINSSLISREKTLSKQERGIGKDIDKLKNSDKFRSGDIDAQKQLAKLEDRLADISLSLQDVRAAQIELNELTSSTNMKFTFNNLGPDMNEGGLSTKADGTVIINYTYGQNKNPNTGELSDDQTSKLANTTHEMKHAYQFLHGRMSQSPAQLGTSLFTYPASGGYRGKLLTEAEAYQRQYSVTEKLPRSLAKSVGEDGSSFKTITPLWVNGVYSEKSGQKVFLYSPNPKK